MKYKITHRLEGYFSAVLLLFSITVGILFAAQFAYHTARTHELELKKQAVSMAGTISQFQQKIACRPGSQRGYGAYLQFISDISLGEVWLVDEHAQTIELDTGSYSLSYAKLPEGTEDLIDQVFKGQVASNKAFSPMLDVSSITVGAPVYDSEGNIIAAFLIHSPVNGIHDARRHSTAILIACILTALLLTFALSVALTRHFIRPLQEIGQAAEKVMAGDYSARAQVDQDDEIGALASNINNLFAQLSDIESQRHNLDKIQQDFVSNVSHELRTPITVIKGSLEVLEQGLVTDQGEMQDYFRQMLSDTLHLERLVNDLLELSRLQNSNFEISKARLDLADVLTDSVRSIQRISDKKQVDIRFENTAGTVLFCGDYGRLRQMFLIVLDNAVKFSPPRSTVSVTMQYDRQKNQCAIAVSDCGCGIQPEDIPYIFNRFYKNRSESNYSGSGLGLPIAKQIASRHQISITCKSNFCDRTTFTFLLTPNPDSSFSCLE